MAAPYKMRYQWSQRPVWFDLPNLVVRRLPRRQWAQVVLQGGLIQVEVWRF